MGHGFMHTVWDPFLVIPNAPFPQQPPSTKLMFSQNSSLVSGTGQPESTIVHVT